MCRLGIRYMDSHIRGPQAELNLPLSTGTRFCHRLAAFAALTHPALSTVQADGFESWDVSAEPEKLTLNPKS